MLMVGFSVRSGQLTNSAGAKVYTIQTIGTPYWHVQLIHLSPRIYSRNYGTVKIQ